MQEETGAAAPNVVRAYLAREVFGMVPLWRAIEALDDKVLNAVQSALVIDAGRLIVRATLWFLRHREHLADLSRSIEHFGGGAQRIEKLFPDILPAAERSAFEAAVARLTKDGAPCAIATRAAGWTRSSTSWTSSKSPPNASATSNP